MPQLLREILYVIETFYNYAREDGTKATLTCRELKQLIQGEFGEILQPSVIHAVERKLDILDIDRNDNITFEEFILAIFNLLNLCYLDIQSLLNSEPRPMSKSGNNLDDVDPQGTLPMQDEEGLPSGIKLSAQPSLKERAEDEHNREDQQGDAKIHSLPQEASGTNVPRKQHLVGDEQIQDSSQDAHARRSNEVQPETKNTTSEARHTSSSINQAEQDEEIPGEGDKPASDQSDQETRQHFEGQGKNVDIQSSTQEAATQKSSKNQEVDLEKDIDLEKTAAQKPCPKQKSTEPENENKKDETEEVKRTTSEAKNSVEPEYTDTASEIQEPPVQKTKELPVQGDASSASKTTDFRTKDTEGRDSGVCRIAEQRESEEKTHPLTLIDQIQEEKYQEIQESLKEWNTQKSSMTQELNLEGKEDVHPRNERATVPEEARLAEKRKAETLTSDEIIFAAAAGNPELRDQKQELVQLENKSGRENNRVDQTSDKPIKEDSDYQGQYHEPTVTQNYERSPKTDSSPIPKNPESDPEASNQSGQRESHRQAEPFTEYVQGSQNGNPNTQKLVTLGEENITREVVLQLDRKDESLTEEHGGKHQSNHSSVTKGTEPALEPSGQPEELKSIEEAENTKSSLEKEIPGTLKEDLKNQVSITQCPAKKDGRKELPVLIVSIRKEDETLESQKILVKNRSENNLDLERQEPETWKKEKDSYSVSQSDLNEKIERNQQLFSAETGTLSSNPSCMYPQENILQQTDITQNLAQPIKASNTELHNDPSKILLTSESQDSQQCTKELLNEGPEGTKQTASIQALEDKQDLEEKSQYHREARNTEQ